MTIKETIKEGAIRLKTGNISEPNLKARILMQYILNKSRQYIVVYDNEILSLRQEVNYFKAIKQMIEGTPIQYITHNQEFMKLNFYVDSNVLIPRPDTEILVEEVIKISKKINAKKILDLCTGSGAIAVSLSKYLSDVDIVATDISSKSLNIAKVNAKNNGVENNITFILSDLFKNVPDEKYDIIVSNPPYIKKNVINELSEEVKNEPHIALDGGEDGLDFYRKIIHFAKGFLKTDGFLCMEIGYDQKESVEKIIKEEKMYKNIYFKKDLQGICRVVVCNGL